MGVAARLNLIAPVVEQPQYSMLHRERFEVEYAPLFKKYGMGTTIWSPLASGLLTGKYNDGIPKGSRFDTSSDFFQNVIKGFETPEGKAKFAKIKKLADVAKKVDATQTQLALAWAAYNPNVSTVILGASSPHQLHENIKALDTLKKLQEHPEIIQEIEEILENKPAPAPTYGR